MDSVISPKGTKCTSIKLFPVKITIQNNWFLIWLLKLPFLSFTDEILDLFVQVLDLSTIEDQKIYHRPNCNCIRSLFWRPFFNPLLEDQNNAWFPNKKVTFGPNLAATSTIYNDPYGREEYMRHRCWKKIKVILRLILVHFACSFYLDLCKGKFPSKAGYLFDPVTTLKTLYTFQIKSNNFEIMPSDGKTK